AKEFRRCFISLLSTRSQPVEGDGLRRGLLQHFANSQIKLVGGRGVDLRHHRRMFEMADCFGAEVHIH
uniref:Uncharacterized protein n=1 Tax=Romanomermis culicivorax TaxID=13658 RepID=A0A915J6B8_ROMCU